MNMARGTADVVFGDVWYEPRGECGPRVQSDYQLVIVHLGEADLTFERQRCVIAPGAVALRLPGQREHFRFSRRHRTHHTWCAVHPRAVPPALRKRLAHLPAVQPQSEAFELLMKAAFTIRDLREEAGQESYRLLGLALLNEYARMAESVAAEGLREGPAARARLYLDEHAAEENCLAEATRASGVTQQHLIRLFRQHYRITPARYLWQTRAERAANLLTATGLTLGEIAERCGFKNPFHLSRLLRQMQGASPRKLRQRAWVKQAQRGKRAARQTRPSS